MFQTDELDLLKNSSNNLGVKLPAYTQVQDVRQNVITYCKVFVFAHQYLLALEKSLPIDQAALKDKVSVFLGLPEVARKMNDVLRDIDGSFTDYKNMRLLVHVLEEDQHVDFLMMETVQAFQIITSQQNFAVGPSENVGGIGRI